MSASTTPKLYTAQVLALATDLAAYPWDDALPLHGTARSRSCGSTLTLGLALDPKDRIIGIGLRAHACAIGQAAAAVFAGAAVGRDGDSIRQTSRDITAWLAGEGAIPDWPGLDAIAAARAYPGRHGAILLAWQAASDVLP